MNIFLKSKEADAGVSTELIEIQDQIMVEFT